MIQIGQVFSTVFGSVVGVTVGEAMQPIFKQLGHPQRVAMLFFFVTIIFVWFLAGTPTRVRV